MSGRPQCLYVQEHTEQITTLVRGKDGVALGSSNELMHMFARQLNIQRSKNYIEENVYK